MKSKLTTVLFLTIISFSILSSCKKDDPKPTAKEMLVGKWMFISVERSNGDIQTPQNDCQRKTHYLFDADSHMEVANYSLKEGICNGEIESANYTLSMDGKKIIIMQGSGAAIYEIRKLTDKQLIFFRLNSQSLVTLKKAN